MAWSYSHASTPDSHLGSMCECGRRTGDRVGLIPMAAMRPLFIRKPTATGNAHVAGNAGGFTHNRQCTHRDDYSPEVGQSEGGIL